MFSFTQIVLNNTEEKVYYQGLQLANENKVALASVRNNGCRAIVEEDDKYTTSLGFTRIGVPYFDCVCGYYGKHKHLACQHVVAAALAYDRHRSVPDLDAEIVKSHCVTDVTPPKKAPHCYVCSKMGL